MHIVGWIVLGSVVVFTSMILLLVYYMKITYQNLVKKTDEKSSYLLGLIKEKDKQFISFEESFIGTKIPTLQFEIYGKQFRFLLDTGADNNYIDQSIMGFLREEKKECAISKGTPFYTALGTSQSSFNCKLPFKYRGNEFEEEFNIADLSKGFEALESAKGLKVSGILGSSFFEKHKWQLDFEKLVVWCNLAKD